MNIIISDSAKRGFRRAFGIRPAFNRQVFLIQRYPEFIDSFKLFSDWSKIGDGIAKAQAEYKETITD